MAVSGGGQWLPRIGAGEGAPDCPPLSVPSGAEPAPSWCPAHGMPCPFLRLLQPPQSPAPLGAGPCPAPAHHPPGMPGSSLIFPLALDTARPRNNRYSLLC